MQVERCITTIQAIAMPPLLRVAPPPYCASVLTSFSSNSLTKSVSDLQTSYRYSIHILIDIILMQWRRLCAAAAAATVAAFFLTQYQSPSIWGLLTQRTESRNSRGAVRNIYHASLLEDGNN